MAFRPIETSHNGMTPEEYRRRLFMAQQLGETSDAPITHWAQGLNNMVRQGLSGYLTGNAEREARAARTAYSDRFNAALGGGAPMRRDALVDTLSAAPGVTGAAPSGATPMRRDAVVDAVSAPSDALSLIRDFEGYREEPYWDVNAHRAGYGSDTVTRSDGSVAPVAPGMSVSRDDAERDLARRVNTEFVPRAMSAVGEENWNALAPNQQAALASITYNYGSLPKGVASAVASGNRDAAVDAIRALASHNDGVNAGRRNREAAIFAGADGVGGGATGATGGDVEELIRLLADPWASEGQRAVLQSEIARRQQAADPLRNMQLQKAQIELDQMRNPAAPKPMEIEGQLVDPSTGRVIGDYRRPEAPQDPAEIRALQWRAREAGLQPGTPAYAQFMLQGGAGQAGFAVDTLPDGSVSIRQGAGAGTSTRPLTEQQSKDVGFLTRMQGSRATLDAGDHLLTNPIQRGLDNDATGIGRGALQTPEYQTARAAGQEWVTALLRKDTGAAVTEAEDALYGGMYLGQPGDSQAVLDYKRAARARAEEGLRAGLPTAAIVAQEEALRRAQQGQGAPAQGQTPSTSDLPAPRTAAERDALPSGTRYRAPDGKVWVKQ